VLAAAAAATATAALRGTVMCFLLLPLLFDCGRRRCVGIITGLVVVEQRGSSMKKETEG
jgi:hypothetical protein